MLPTSTIIRAPFQESGSELGDERFDLQTLTGDERRNQDESGSER